MYSTGSVHHIIRPTSPSPRWRAPRRQSSPSSSLSLINACASTEPKSPRARSMRPEAPQRPQEEERNLGRGRSFQPLSWVQQVSFRATFCIPTPSDARFPSQRTRQGRYSVHGSSGTSGKDSNFASDAGFALAGGICR